MTYEGDFGMTLGHFGVTLGSFWDHFAHSWVTLRSFWVYEAYFGVTLVHFQKTFILPIDFNDLIYSSYHFGIDLESFGGHFGFIFGI